VTWYKKTSVSAGSGYYDIIVRDMCPDKVAQEYSVQDVVSGSLIVCGVVSVIPTLIVDDDRYGCCHFILIVAWLMQ
jgi:hypothetical protein